MACAVIFRSRAIPGLFIGSVATGFLFLNDFSSFDVLIFAFLSATLPYAALLLTERLRPFDKGLTNFSLQHASTMGLCYALLNATFHFAYRYQDLFLRDIHQFKALLAMMVGDILGILCFMYLLAWVTRNFLPQLKLKK
jgi:hypothetical protein